ncbi:hypothetical protein DS745_05400 [Anaerobacillus alkaliphilus]|uniref:DUF1269 domain-containing protein n=1 Tax=Anaerobacillus alkaliphilus TaxID=1548597 RepID=A0A4V1LGQ5_9BACI|nr:hypothetical protein [Anaerobacillus alkaliphilus]RXJ02748.1 hypothetical protein DS745_05400 [Anaerobacillus alkaliphilus]
MIVVSSFEQSENLELAIINLQQNGINKQRILAVPFDKRREERKLFDSIHRSDGVSLFDIAAALGTAFSVLGASYGFILKWGPIIWGLIGFAVGAILGFIIDYFYTKMKTKDRNKVPTPFTEVVLIVECSESDSRMVSEILWTNLALGVSIVGKSSLSQPTNSQTQM